MTGGSGSGGGRGPADGGRGNIDAGALADRPYKAVHDTGTAPDTTHVLARLPDGSFSGYGACGAAPDGWVWSPSGRVSCRACLLAAASSSSSSASPSPASPANKTNATRKRGGRA